jgi:TetR/AcrR family transcriptional repressor of mexJK operon
VTLPADHDQSDCRSRLIQAATEVFIEEGYRASIERVALRAGVARQTLYNHFPSKADLFGEVIKQATAALLVTLDGKAEGLRERLLRFGIAFRAKALSAEGLGFYRALIAATMRFPELAATFYRTGPAQTAARLRVVLQEAMDRGELRPGDSDFATITLLSMLVGAERGHYLLSGEPPPEPDPARVADLIDCYLRAFAPLTPETPAISPFTPASQRSIP